MPADFTASFAAGRHARYNTPRLTGPGPTARRVNRAIDRGGERCTRTPRFTPLRSVQRSDDPGSFGRAIAPQDAPFPEAHYSYCREPVRIVYGHVTDLEVPVRGSSATP